MVRNTNNYGHRLKDDTFPFVSVIFITYRRLGLLKESVETFLKVVEYPREKLELVIADDGSPKAIQNALKNLPVDKIVAGKRNSGMGANTNRGLAEASGDLILQLQDDWACVGPGDFLRRAVRVMRECPRVSLIRFRPARRELLEEVLSSEGEKVECYLGYLGSDPADASAFAYSDNPHLKSRALHEELGPYAEGIPMPRTELDFCARFAQGASGRAVFIRDLVPFEHRGAEQSFNPSVRRARWKDRLEALPMGQHIVEAIRWARRRKGRGEA